MKKLLLKFLNIFGIKIKDMSRISFSKNKEILKLDGGVIRISAIEAILESDERNNATIILVLHSYSKIITYPNFDARDKDFKILQEVIFNI